MDTLSITGQQAPHLRPWRDLSKRRLLVGLVVAPVPPIALGGLILTALGGGLLDAAALWRTLGFVLAAAEIWSMLLGTIFLLASRSRGGVRRAHCLLLGAFLAFSLPAAAYLTSGAVDWAVGATPHTERTEDLEEDDLDATSDGRVAFIVGVFLVPFGTLGGWVFWRIGVYPARPKAINVATVFD